MTIKIRDCVQRGATLLDEYMPGWFEVIDTTSLNLNSPYSCILGQLRTHQELMSRDMLWYIGHQGRFHGLDFTVTLNALEFASRHGIEMYSYGFIEECTFDTKHNPVHDANSKSWKEAIRLRKLQKAQREADEALRQTPLAKQVAAAIDVEYAKILDERSKAAYSLVA